jgi:uncharacterized membrane protein YfcA
MLPLIALTAAAVSFTVSASAGLGGSLLLVPALSLALGTKEGVALAALLLAANNVAKVIAYRKTIPLRPSVWVIVLTMIGSFIGANALVLASETWATVFVIAGIVGSLIVEQIGLARLQKASTPILALGAGLTSGLSGTSGPLKGVALRNLRFDRLHLVGAASAVSLAGDATKLAVFTEAQLLGRESLIMLAMAAPLMVLATLIGRHVNRQMGEVVFARLFWAVMAGYTVRLVLR